jgi:hypothetical protein
MSSSRSAVSSAGPEANVVDRRGSGVDVRSRPVGGHLRYRQPDLRAPHWNGLFLSAAYLLSLSLYTGGLGFYSDDWAFLASIAGVGDQGLAARYYALETQNFLQARPGQALYILALYQAFGLHPLGYHLINAAVSLGGVLLFYVILRNIGLSRLLSLSAALLFAVLPNYSTDRFWLASFQVSLHTTLLLLTVYAELRALSAGARAWWNWAGLAVLSLVASGLTYEVALPLIVLSPVLFWLSTREQGSRVSRSRVSTMLVANFALLVGYVGDRCQEAFSF